jgi:hypothetical protein
LGPTFFLFPRVLEEIFAAAGASLRSEVEMVRLDSHYRIVFGEGGELDATAEISRMEAQIVQLSLADAAGFRRFLEENRDKLRRMEPCLEAPFLGWRDIFNVQLLKMLPMLRPHQSIDTYLKRFFRDPTHSSGFLVSVKVPGHRNTPSVRWSGSSDPFAGRCQSERLRVSARIVAGGHSRGLCHACSVSFDFGSPLTERYLIRLEFVRSWRFNGLPFWWPGNLPSGRAGNIFKRPRGETPVFSFRPGRTRRHDGIASQASERFRAE